MKIFVATDIHGSAYWAQKVVEKFRQTQADILVLLGDIYNHGPRNPFPQDYAPMKVAEILSEVKDSLIVTKGNCDSEVDQMISPFTFVQNNVLFLGKRRLFFTHGHIFNSENLPSLSRGDVLFFGHTHINKTKVVNGVICVNVSSCALPKDEHSYCVAEESGLTLWSFDGEILEKKDF